MANDNRWVVEFKDFEVGFSPLAQVDSLTERGNAGSASAMTDCDILDGILMQGPGLSAMATAPTELINHILDVPPRDSLTYGIGATKLYSISPTAITNDGTFPHTITDCTDGESVAQLGSNVYYFWNNSAGGDIGKYSYPSTFDDDWGSTTPTWASPSVSPSVSPSPSASPSNTASASPSTSPSVSLSPSASPSTPAGCLENAPHPVATKEDIMLFGNGRYAGVYFDDNATLQTQLLDFQAGHEVADVCFNNNYWFIAVNSGTGTTNRAIGQIFLYDGAAFETTLADETGVGFQKIGFLYVIDGVVYVAYQDLSSTGGYHIGYVNGRKISRLASFTGSLPTYAQKTLYRHTILFASSGKLWTCGAVSPELPVQISQIADGGYATVGAVAAPFGTPMVASYTGSSYQLAKFSGYSIATEWKSVVVPVTGSGIRGYIDDVQVLTKALGANAAATLKIESNQGVNSSGAKVISGTGTTRHQFSGFGLGTIEDLRAYVYFSNGNVTNPCPIRSIQINGHWVES